VRYASSTEPARPSAAGEVRLDDDEEDDADDGGVAQPAIHRPSSSTFALGPGIDGNAAFTGEAVASRAIASRVVERAAVGSMDFVGTEVPFVERRHPGDRRTNIRSPAAAASANSGIPRRSDTLPPVHPSDDNPRGTVYARLGPAPIAAIAAALYRRIDRDPRIRAMFSPDLSESGEAVRDMREFLTQFFGGPEDYSARKGHPRLRARHMRFPIDQAAREAWLSHALGALDDARATHAIDDDTAREIAGYFHHASAFMINQPG